MVNNQLSICIVGKGNSKYLSKSIDYASKISREVIYVDLGPDDQSKSKANEWGAQVVELNSFASALQTEWVLFIKPEERAFVSSAKKFQKMIRNKQAQGYGIYSNSIKTRHLLENYQWIMKLDQFKNTENVAYVAKIEPRLVRKSLGEICLRALSSNNTEGISWVCGKIAEGIAIETILNEEPNKEESAQDHDIRCLKGELTYDVNPVENMVELSEAYTGFRIVRKEQLDGFIEGAKRGFGNLKMYVWMLDFLYKEGYFNEAKDLFEQWIEHRPDDKEAYNTQLLGGMIYSNLLEFDRAIEWFKRITEKSESALACANLGKLYLIKGDKDRAVEYLRRSKDTKSDIFLKQRILSIIDRDDWHPLKLSLCMIAKDEEAVIGKSLQSVKGIVDEIIVVDTGSSDRTKEIIREFEGKIFETEWENDFSKAKNLAIKQATGDYILFMDADEYIDPRYRFALALFKKLLPVERNIAFGIKVEPVKEAKILAMSYLDKLSKKDESDTQIRLFPRKGGIHFQGRVFEDQNEALKAAEVEIASNDMFKIIHSMEGRERRDGRKLRAALNSFESIHDSQKALEGGILFLRLGDLDRAYPWLVKAQEMNPELSAKIGALYSKQNKPEMAKGILTGALKQFPDSPELLLSMAEVYYRESNYNEVINILADRIEAIVKNLESEDAARAVYYHGIASLETGNFGDGIEYLAFAHEKEPANLCYKIAGIYAFSKVGQWEEALQVAGQIIDEEEIDISCEVNGFVDVGEIFMGLNRHFNKEGEMEAASLCQKIVEDVIKTKLSGDDDIQKMSEVIEGMGEAQAL